MNKLFLTMLLALGTTIASAQFSIITTVTEVEDEYNFTDKLAVGYDLNEKLMLGVAMDGEDKYEVIGRYHFADNCWAYGSFDTEGEGEYVDRLDLGVGYSFKVIDNLFVEPNYTMSMKKNDEDEYDGKLNLSLSYKF
tara:strand:+ start:181 stop:591 length:411 start_codon:yes stop_codon:yes gene_type:complete